MKIHVYADEGVSSFSLQETLSTFRKVSPHVHPIGYQKLIESDWEKETDLLIIPGGRDIPYDRRLKGKGTAKIRAFVESGGSFLGICAGAYFASNEVIFEKDTPLEVHESRDLKFFPGSAIGTLYLPRRFAYDSEKGSHASEITLGDESCHLYYNGGCTFYQAEKFSSVTILARYQDAGNQPAIIHCKVGKGSVILSGVHFEVSPEPLKKEGCKEEVVQKLEASDEIRKKLIFSLIQYL
jgi:biotin--protein ligase